MSSRKLLDPRLLALGLAMSIALHAQEPKLQVKPAAPEKPAADTLSLSAKLVNLPVIVRDKQNRLVQNLTKDDFVLQVDGHPQTIHYFDRDNNLPLTIGLLVDVSRSQASVLDEERKASSQFIDQMLTAAPGRKPDVAFVIQFGHSSELLQDLTDSHPKLQAAIQQIDTDADSGPPQPAGNDPNDPNNPNNNGGAQQQRQRRRGTTLYDAIYLASNELMAKQTGRKALIVLTDGVDSGSKKSLASAIEAAQRADVVVYTIYFKGQERQDFNQQPQRRGGGGYPGGGYPGGGYPGGGYPGGGYPGGGGGGRGGNYPPSDGGGSHVPFVDGKKVLERISGETGAAMFEVKGKNKVSVIFDQLAEELRSQYRLGYTPDEKTAAEGYHRIELTVPRQKNDFVQTREGYYTGN
jgi:VWFA-related protein